MLEYNIKEGLMVELVYMREYDEIGKHVTLKQLWT